MKFLILIFAIMAVGYKPTESAFSFAQACNKTCVQGTNIACEADNIELCSNGIMINSTGTMRTAVLYAHNSFRNAVANGSLLPVYSKADRMGVMSWDDELASMIDLNIRSCNYGYDLCSRTDNYPLSGQNLGFVEGAQYSTYSESAVLAAIDTIITSWFGQNVYGDMSIIRKYQPNYVNDITRFTNLCVGKSARIGCAAVWFPGRINFGCNYAQGSLIQMPIYSAGPTASNCTTGPDTKFSGLCSSTEKYNYKTSF